MQDGKGVIEVNSTCGLFVYSQRLIHRPVVEIDGATNEIEWGTERFEVPAGRHHVRIWIQARGVLNFGKKLYENSTDVMVEEAEVVEVGYDHLRAITSFGKNALSVEGGMVMQPAAVEVGGAGTEFRAGAESFLQGTATLRAGAACASCGMNLPAEARFCQECGTPVVAAIRNCPSCGNSQSSGKFCAGCGAPMEG